MLKEHRLYVHSILISSKLICLTSSLPCWTTACSFAFSHSWTLQFVPSASLEWKKLRHYDCGEMLCNRLHRTFLLIYFWMAKAKLQRGYAIDSLSLASLYSPDPSLGFYHPPRLTIHCIFMYLFAFLPKLILLVFVFTEIHCFAPFLQAVKIILNPNDNGFPPLPPLWCHI